MEESKQTLLAAVSSCVCCWNQQYKACSVLPAKRPRGMRDVMVLAFSGSLQPRRPISVITTVGFTVFTRIWSEHNTGTLVQCPSVAATLKLFLCAETYHYFWFFNVLEQQRQIKIIVLSLKSVLSINTLFFITYYCIVIQTTLCMHHWWQFWDYGKTDSRTFSYAENKQGLIKFHDTNLAVSCL